MVGSSYPGCRTQNLREGASVVTHQLLFTQEELTCGVSGQTKLVVENLFSGSQTLLTQGKRTENFNVKLLQFEAQKIFLFSLLLRNEGAPPNKGKNLQFMVSSLKVQSKLRSKDSGRLHHMFYCLFRIYIDEFQKVALPSKKRGMRLLFM